MNTLSAFDTESIMRQKGRVEPFLLILKKGEELMESIVHCAKSIELNSAALSGIGAVEHPTLGYYDTESKSYHDKSFEGSYEIISLNGNITTYEDQYLAHVHIGLGSIDYTLVGGHLRQAKISVTAEIMVTPLSSPIARKLNNNLKMPLIETQS